MHWAAKYIGLPYKEGGRGPDTFDCWGLVRWIYEQEFQILLPDYPGISSASVSGGRHTAARLSLESEWSRVEIPFDGCGVGMSQSRFVHHVGLYVTAGRGKVIHAWKGANTIADGIPKLIFKGFRSLTFYRHRQWPSS